MMHVGDRVKTVGLSHIQTLKASGDWKLLGMAPSVRAVNTLQQVGIPAITSQKARVSEQFWNSVDANTVIVLDEAHLIAAEVAMAIVERADECGARVVLLAQ